MAYTSIDHAEQPVLYKLFVIVDHRRHINELKHLRNLALVIVKVHLNLYIYLLIFVRRTILNDYELLALQEVVVLLE